MGKTILHRGDELVLEYSHKRNYFKDVAQSSNTYEAFQEKISQVPEKSLRYFGIAIFGNKKKVNKLIGRIPLLR